MENDVMKGGDRHEEERRKEEVLASALTDARRKVKGAIAELTLAVVPLRKTLDTIDALLDERKSI